MALYERKMPAQTQPPSPERQPWGSQLGEDGAKAMKAMSGGMGSSTLAWGGALLLEKRGVEVGLGRAWEWEVFPHQALARMFAILLQAFLSAPKGTPCKGRSCLAKHRLGLCPTRLPGLILPVCLAEEGPWGASPVDAHCGFCQGWVGEGGRKRERPGCCPGPQLLLPSQLAPAPGQKRNGGVGVVSLAEHTIQGHWGRVSGWGTEAGGPLAAAYSR